MMVVPGASRTSPWLLGVVVRSITRPLLSTWMRPTRAPSSPAASSAAASPFRSRLRPRTMIGRELSRRRGGGAASPAEARMASASMSPPARSSATAAGAPLIDRRAVRRTAATTWSAWKNTTSSLPQRLGQPLE